jgi:hypothetical protein
MNDMCIAGIAPEALVESVNRFFSDTLPDAVMVGLPFFTALHIYGGHALQFDICMQLTG